MQKLMNLTSALMIKNVPYHKKEHLRLIVKNIGVALNVEMEVGDVVSAARQHTEYQKPGSPSNVLAMFREQSLRDAFLLQYLNYNKKLLGTDVGIVSASEIYVDECLPTTTLTKIHKAVIQKKKHPKDEEIKVFSFHGEIFIKSNGMEAQIKNSHDCKEFLDSLD